MFLSADDLSLIKKAFYKEKERTLSSVERPKAYTTGISPTLNPMILNILGRYLDLSGSKIYQAFLLESFIPWNVHSDYDKGDEDPTLAILIPFETVDTHTIIFDQECLGELDGFLDSNHPINDPETLAEHKGLLSHVNQQILSYLTIKERARWEEGKLISWDRKLLHCSDNFSGKGIANKSAAVLFLTKA